MRCSENFPARRCGDVDDNVIIWPRPTSAEGRQRFSERAGAVLEEALVRFLFLTGQQQAYAAPCSFV